MEPSSKVSMYIKPVTVPKIHNVMNDDVIELTEALGQGWVGSVKLQVS